MKRIKRLATRLLEDLPYLPYHDRLRQLGLHSLNRRRLRNDDIVTRRLNLALSSLCDSVWDGTLLKLSYPESSNVLILRTSWSIDTGFSRLIKCLFRQPRQAPIGIDIKGIASWCLLYHCTPLRKSVKTPVNMTHLYCRRVKVWVMGEARVALSPPLLTLLSI